MTITEHLCTDRPTDASLASFSAVTNVTLPDDYKDFLKRENGGRPAPRKFKFTTRQGRREDGAVHYFFGLHEGLIGNLKGTLDRFRQRIPTGYLPVATDPFGNLILLKVTAPSLGSMHFWDHEKEEDLPTLKNVSLIAGSFLEFIEGLDTA